MIYYIYLLSHKIYRKLIVSVNFAYLTTKIFSRKISQNESCCSRRFDWSARKNSSFTQSPHSIGLDVFLSCCLPLFNFKSAENFFKINAEVASRHRYLRINWFILLRYIINPTSCFIRLGNASGCLYISWSKLGKG